MTESSDDNDDYPDARALFLYFFDEYHRHDAKIFCDKLVTDSCDLNNAVFIEYLQQKMIEHGHSTQNVDRLFELLNLRVHFYLKKCSKLFVDKTDIMHRFGPSPHLPLPNWVNKSDTWFFHVYVVETKRDGQNIVHDFVRAPDGAEITLQQHLADLWIYDDNRRLFHVAELSPREWVEVVKRSNGRYSVEILAEHNAKFLHFDSPSMSPKKFSLNKVAPAPSLQACALDDVLTTQQRFFEIASQCCQEIATHQRSCPGDAVFMALQRYSAQQINWQQKLSSLGLKVHVFLKPYSSDPYHELHNECFTAHVYFAAKSQADDSYEIYDFTRRNKAVTLTEHFDDVMTCMDGYQLKAFHIAEFSVAQFFTNYAFTRYAVADMHNLCNGNPDFLVLYRFVDGVRTARFSQEHGKK